MRRVLSAVAARLAARARRRGETTAAAFTSVHTPLVLEAYARFEKTNQSGTSRQPYKGWDLWQLLERHQPRSIVELGSGTTSAVFALWATQHGARYVCYEHHEAWGAVTAAVLRESGLLGEGVSVRVVPMRVRDDRGATGFVDPIPPGADFIYVDGPPCKLEDGRKVPNDDVTRFLEAGGRPRAVVVDGRLETVDLIRRHPAARGYTLLPSFAHALATGAWREAARGREHSVFSAERS